MSSGAALVHRTADGSSVVLGVHRSTANFGDYNLAVPIAGALEATLNGFALGRAPEPGVRMASAVPDGFRFLSSRRWTGAR
jgi:hypothetical protein